MAPSTEAVEIFRAMANDTPEVLDKLSESSTNLAILLLSQGQDIAAIPLMREAVGSEVRFLQQQLPLMPEGRRQALVDTLGRRWELPFSLALRGEDGASLALYTRLNRHGPLQDVERRQAIIARSSPANQALVTRLSILNAQISNPTLAPQGRQHSIRESERLQEQLHSQLPALKPRLVEISQVARQLPADGALVEFQRFSPYNPAKPEKEAWGKPRYLALVLDRGGVARAMDLGDAAALDQAIASALDRTRLQLPEADRAWVLVAEKVFSPLAVILAGKRQLLLSPDGELHRVPFSALALLAGNTPLVPATLRLQTIGSGRDLIPDPVAPQPPAPAAPLVLADPTTSGWPSLVRAAREGQEVASALGVKALLGRAATVSALEQARGPRIIHVAGHGYFDPQAKGDPLLASGLSLAGADKAKQPSQTQDQPSSPQLPALSTMPNAVPSDDGYLTAKEAARLQLEGTALVVLSACESGRGNNRSGEGLFGLRRSLTVAGARGTLLSLWRVPEHATETFMTRFYTHLRQGVSPAQAVRQVQEEFRSKPRIPGWSDPFYWAGWQYSGLPDPVR
jgi:CHAT domain-containing protein